MISVLSAVAEIERENICVQTMEGRIQKAREGQHEAIISEDIWQAAQAKLLSQAKKYEHVNREKDEHTHLLSGIVKCLVCGAGMYGNKSIKRKKDGTKYKDFYYSSNLWYTVNKVRAAKSA